MNIYLIPYTHARHVVVALPVAAAALIAWWWTLFLFVVLGPWFHDAGFWWSMRVEGAVYLGNVSGAVAFATVLLEGSLRRRALHFRLGFAIIAALIAILGAWIAYAIWVPLVPYLGAKAMRPVLEDASLVSLRYQLPLWVGAGVASGFGPLASRALQQLLAIRWQIGVDAHAPMGPPVWTEYATMGFHHVVGAGAAAAFGAAAWHALGFYEALQGDLYVAAAVGPFVWGLVHGLLVWPIPDDLYAGWVRVLSAERYGLRIPVPRVDGSPAERFLGHFPRGLDLYLPAEQGVAELHTSFVVDGAHRYAVRGLSVQTTLVKRFLERIDLRYDPRRPAPLETSLNSEDRILLGPNGESEVEFLMLPKEER